MYFLSRGFRGWSSVYYFGFRDKPRRMLKNATLKMAAAMFAETLDNVRTFDAAHPRKPKLYM
jgi:hypothetical protein